MREALEKAIAKADGTNALAAVLSVSPQRLSNWLARGTPAEFCPTIEQITGVRVERLRPDLRWIRIKGRPFLDVAPVNSSISRNVSDATKRGNPLRRGVMGNTVRGRKAA